jgi:dienelactone hydrolase
VMGPLPRIDHRAPLDVQVLEEERNEKWTRRRITYRSESNDRVPAYLFLPTSVKKSKRPAMLCLHQTTKIGKAEPAGFGPKKNLQYAVELAERGYVTLAPDYPNFGDYKIDVYAAGYSSATMKGIVNHMRAIDLLQSLPEVDPKRIGVVGHSLGGHNSLFVAAFDKRIKVTVSSCGFNSFAKYMKGDLTGWSHKGYMPRIATLFDRDAAKMPFDFSDVLAEIAPRAVFVNAPVDDANFEVSGVYQCLRQVAKSFPQGKLMAVHPGGGHDFLPEVREKAWAFVDGQLKR